MRAAASPLPAPGPASCVSRWRGADRQQVLAQTATVLAVAALVLPPVLMLVYGSLRTAQPGVPGSFSVRPYSRLVTPHMLQTVSNTLTLSVGGSLLAVVGGTLLAFLLCRTDTPGRLWLTGLVTTSLYVPTFMSAAGWFLLASPNAGALNQFAHWIWPALPRMNILSLGGMIWVLGLSYTPYVFLLLRGPFSTIDPVLEEAARTSGAGPGRTLLRVTLPLVTYSLVSGFLVTFVQTLGNFGVPGVLGLPARKFVLTTEIWNLVQFYPADYNTAAALAIALMAITALAIVIQRLIVARREYTAITGKGYRPHAIPLGRWRLPAAATCWLYVLTGIGLPVATLVYSSLIPFWTLDPRAIAISLTNYHKVLFEHPLVWRALRNSTVLSVGGATVGVLIAALVSYFTIRGPRRSRAPLDLLSSMPLAIPGLCIGLGLIWTYVTLPIGVYGTVWILILSYVTHYLPHATRAVSSNMIQLDDALEESARVAGASWTRTFRRVVLPLVRPGVISGWLVLVVSFYRELSSAVMLYTPENVVLSVLIWGLYLNAEWGLLSALAVMVLAVIFGIYALAIWLGGRVSAWSAG